MSNTREAFNTACDLYEEKQEKQWGYHAEYAAIRTATGMVDDVRDAVKDYISDDIKVSPELASEIMTTLSNAARDVIGGVAFFDANHFITAVAVNTDV